jgi:hypothetical protein
MEGCDEFAQDLKEMCKTDHAYIGFFTKFPQFHGGYSNRIRICVQYQWEREASIPTTSAHGPCHIFGAADEYKSSDCQNCDSDGRGYYKVYNGNCANCAANPVDCLMSNNASTLCSFTQGQLGWLPQSGLFVLHQSSEGDALSYSVLDNNEHWWQDRLVSNVSISGAPSAVMVGGKLFCLLSRGSQPRHPDVLGV